MGETVRAEREEQKEASSVCEEVEEEEIEGTKPSTSWATMKTRRQVALPTVEAYVAAKIIIRRKLKHVGYIARIIQKAIDAQRK